MNATVTTGFFVDLPCLIAGVVRRIEIAPFSDRLNGAFRIAAYSN